MTVAVANTMTTGAGAVRGQSDIGGAIGTKRDDRAFFSPEHDAAIGPFDQITDAFPHFDLLDVRHPAIADPRPVEALLFETRNQHVALPRIELLALHPDDVRNPERRHPGKERLF